MPVEVVMCEECNNLQLAPAVVCRRCGAGHVRNTELPGRGRLYTYTTIHVPPENWNKKVPYVVGVLRMINGLLLTASCREDSFDKLVIGDEFDVWVENSSFIFTPPDSRG